MSKTIDLTELTFIKKERSTKGNTFKVTKTTLYISINIAEVYNLTKWNVITWAESPKFKNSFILVGYESLEQVPPQLKPYILNVQHVEVKSSGNVTALKVNSNKFAEKYGVGDVQCEPVTVGNTAGLLCNVIKL